MNLLEALQEKDPETYTAYQSMPNRHLMEGTDVLSAWLQAVLQDACQARGWLLKQSTFTARPSAKIWKVVDPIGKLYYAEGYSPAEALLRCYLEAII